MNRPDLSNYLAHFTKDSSPLVSDTSKPVADYTKEKSAYEKLKSILTSRTIFASTLKWTGREAVCFTECPWSSLIAHSKQYSPYGIGFEKSFIFGTGGAPVFYVRPDHFHKQQWDNHLKTFTTPFSPYYAPNDKEEFTKLGTVDYSHEREWRVPHDLKFEYDKIKFVVLNNYEDMAAFPKDLKDQIGRDKFILMEVYKNIEKLWPVHNLGE